MTQLVDSMVESSNVVVVSRQKDTSIVKSFRSRHSGLFAARSLLAFFLTCSLCAAQSPKKPPQVGEIAPDFELKSLKGSNVSLSEVAKKKKVVLIVLRGFPGYQCPVCNKQVGQFIGEADKFKAAGADVVFIYPGPSENLSKRAEELFQDKTVPDHFWLLVDPDYRFTNAYHLRWDAAKETAYPSTYILQKDRRIVFAKISQSHGGRTGPDEILKELANQP